uniref:UBZ1-type domain-containing protein n=1 Tax=Cacopsylla melanoneura TaxID=428564 RepID=A0A8D9AER7_9HEMI
MDSKQLSNCALQIALQTMKDRCQQLQLRLSNLEDENLKLRIEKRKNESSFHHDKEPRENVLGKLNEEIETLSQQKTQLTHHIFMVATENKQLWTKLSLLTEETNVPEQSINLVKENHLTNHLKEVDINLGKNPDLIEVPKSDLKDAASIKDFEFNLSMMSNNGDDSNNFEIMELAEELNQTKTHLRGVLSQFKTQHQTMKSTVQQLIRCKQDKENNPPLCSNCVHLKKQLRDKTYNVSKHSAFTPQHNTTSDNGMYTHVMTSELDLLSPNESSVMESGSVCPMCKHVELEEDSFLQHVYSHFEESNEGDMCNTTGVNTLEHSTVFPQFNI